MDHSGEAAVPKAPTVPTPVPAYRVAPRKAVGYMVTAVFFLAVLDAGVKALTEAYSVPQIAFIRYVVGLILALGVAARSAQGLQGLSTRRPGGHLIRSICNLGAMLLFYYAIARMALADVVAIAFATPIFTTLFSVLLLKERVTSRRWAAVAVGFAGVLVMVQPGGGVWGLGAVLALASAVLFALTVISSRQLSLTESSHTILFYYSIVCLAATGAALPWQWRTPEPEDLWLFLLVGVMGSLGQFFMNQAFRFGEASMLAPLDYTALIWAAAMGYIFWAEVPSTAVLAGAALVLVSTLLVRSRRPS
ncbi:MAG TPA: DMT family transporter [Alphaproteobacteria bacterium]|nr:DMT family transporter [Alphaproteobacteria bacterium]